MRLIRNTGNDRVIDELRRRLVTQSTLDVASPSFSLFAFSELRDLLSNVSTCRIVIPDPGKLDHSLLGSEADRPFRNRLQARWLARQCIQWLEKKADVRSVSGQIPQATVIMSLATQGSTGVVTGNCPFTTEGLGITPGNQFSLIQCSESAEECSLLGAWFTGLWKSLPPSGDAKRSFLSSLGEVSEHKEPALIYFLTLLHLFKNLGEELDEERIVKSATGIRNTTVWKKLFKFQRDGVVGRDRQAGASSAAASSRTAWAWVKLSRRWQSSSTTSFATTASLVLCPKRLRDNWTLYKANDRRNILASDRFNYDVLNHTDLSRDGGSIRRHRPVPRQLGQLRPRRHRRVAQLPQQETPRKDSETRYDRLMRRIIKEGVKTRVLMLSATPVNNRLADLKNQIAFVTEGDDTALADHGIPSIEAPSARRRTNSIAGST